MTTNDATLDLAFRSARTFHDFTAQAVSDETLQALYDLLKWGPTGMNCQPARFLFVKNREAKERLARSLMPGNVEKTMKAPVTVIVATDTRFYDQLPQQFPSYPGAREYYANDPEEAAATGFRNSCLQAGYLIIAARLLGLDCGPMTGFDAKTLDADFFPDGAWKSNLLINLGHGAPSGKYPRGPRLPFEQAARIL